MVEYQYWSCSNCGFSKNWVEVSKGLHNTQISMRCQRCGVGTESKLPIEVNDNYLQCLPLRGLAARIPAAVPTADSFIAGDGSGPYSKSEYIAKYNVDPLRNWCFRHSEARGCKDLSAYVPMPGVEVPIPELKPKDDDFALEALQKLLAREEISKAIYHVKEIAIVRLKTLKNKNVISQEDYAEDIIAILGKDPKEIINAL